VKFALPEIRHDKSGFEAIVSFIEASKDCSFDSIEIDMKQVKWFDADMCAAFGAILYRLGDSINEIEIINVHLDVEKILSKNGFLSHYGRVPIPDNCGTTIPYKRFNVSDDRYFASVV
jgi:hypothetical protein